MNIAACVLAFIGVALNFCMPIGSNPGANLSFGMFFMRYIEATVGFFIFGILSLVFIVNQIMALFKGYHALKRRRDKNVAGFFKFTAVLCGIYAAITFFAYSSYMEVVRSSGFYVLSDFNIAPYIPELLQVLCFALAAHLAHADEKEDENRNNSQTYSYHSEAPAQIAPAPKKQKTFEPVIGVETSALIKRAFMFMTDNDFDEAERYLEQALRQDPENSSAYLGKLMTELKVHNTDELSKVSKSLKGEKLFQRALSFANDEERRQLEGYVEAQKQAETERKYAKAQEMMKTIDSSTRAQHILDLLVPIVPYKDTEALIQEVSQKKKDIEILEKKYADAYSAKREVDRSNLTDIEEINRVAGMFEALGDYKDCKSLAEEIRRSGIERIKEAKRSKLIRKCLIIVVVMAILGAGAFYAYTKISERKAEQARIEAEKNEEKSRIEALKLEL